MSDENHDVGDFNKSALIFNESLITDEQSPPVAELSNEPLDFPLLTVAT